MKRIIFLLIFTPLVFAGVKPQSPPLTIFSDVTDSGIKTYVAQTPRARSVTVKIYFRGGAYGENEKRGSGLANAVKKIIFDNIKSEFKKSENDFIKLNSKTSYDSISFSATALKEKLPDIIDKFGKVICDEKFSKKQWIKTQDFLTDQIIFENKKPWAQLNSLLKKIAFMWSPVKFPIKGKLQLFTELTRDDLLSYYKQYFVAENLIVVVAGDVNPKSVFRLVKNAFANLPKTTGALPKKYAAPIQTAPRWFEQHAAVTQSYVSVSFSTAPAGHFDSTVLNFLSKILRKDELEKDLRANTKNFSEINCYTLSFPDTPEEFVVSFSCDSESAARAARVIEKFMFDLAVYKWDFSEVEREKIKLFTTYLQKLNSPNFIAEKVSNAALRLGNPHFPEISARQILEITPEKITKVCKKYFTPQRLSVAILSPENDDDETLGLSKNNLLRGERALINEFNIPVKKQTLKNGAVLLLRRLPDAPVVNFVFTSIGGLWCENENNNGAFAIIANIMQSLKCKKKKELFYKKFIEKKKIANVFPMAKSNFQTFRLSAAAPPETAEETAEKLCELWTAPDINEKNVSDAIDRLIKLQEADATNIFSLADSVFRLSFFNSQPYRLSLTGSRLSFPFLSAEVVSDVYNDFITPLNTVILVSGNFDEKKISEIIEKALQNFKSKKKSYQFVEQAGKFKLNSTAPIITANFPDEDRSTNQFTKIFASQNSDAVVVCGIEAPCVNSSNFPPCLAKIVRAAFLNQIENLRENWKDIRKKNIIKNYGVTDFQGWNTGWLYAYLSVEKKYEQEAASRLRAALYTALSGLADGSLIKSARARALFESETVSQNTILKNILNTYIYNLPELRGGSFKHQIQQCGGEHFKKYFEQYGKRTVSAIIAPQR